MMEDSAPFSEHSPGTLTVQSRISPTEGKIEACPTGESLERSHAVRRRKRRLS